MLYIITLCIFLILYVLTVSCMKYMKNIKFFNLFFSAMVFVPYLCLLSATYKHSGINHWNFQNALPVANVSPFMFSCVPLILILPERTKKVAHLLISLLSVGMFLSSTLGCLQNAFANRAFVPFFLWDYLAHFSLSLFGVYLIKSKQVEPNRKDCLLSSLMIIGAASAMMVLNLIFDTSFFGLSLTGKHNIYNQVLVKNSVVSALLYYIGLILVLLLGFLYSKYFQKNTSQSAKNPV